MFHCLWGRYSFRSHRREWKIGPDKSVYIITLFLCRMLWWICFTVRNHTLLIKYLCVTWCGSEPLDCSYVLLWIDTVVLYPCSNFLEDYQQFIGDNDHSYGWWTEIFQTKNSSELLLLLYHYMVRVTYLASYLITQMKYGFERWCRWWWWWCSWSSHEIV